jgi:hypothetical protein
MKKLNFKALDDQVIQLYNKKIDSVDEINEYCDFIREFIILNGWTIEEYIQESLRKFIS